MKTSNVSEIVGAGGEERTSWSGSSGQRGISPERCRDSLGIYVLSATYVLSGAAKSLKGTVGTVRCG
jgi:hypothetical protein